MVNSKIIILYTSTNRNKRCIKVTSAKFYHWITLIGIILLVLIRVQVNAHFVYSDSIPGKISTSTNAILSVTASPSSATICLPSSSPVLITENGGGAVSWAWSPAAGLDNTTGSSVLANPVVTTIYTVVGTDSNGFTSSSTSEITVGASPTIASVSSSSNSICTGQSVDLSSSAFVHIPSPVNLYSFTVSSVVSSADMSGATVLLGPGLDLVSSAVTNIGFVFNFGGVEYSQFSVSSNGVMGLGAIAVTNADGNNSTTVPSIIPSWDDMHTGNNGNVRYLLTGISPNQILIVEWNYRNFSTNTPEGPAFTKTVQAWLYEGSNVIKFIYGSNTGSPLVSATVGIVSGAGIFNDVNTFTKFNNTVTAQNANTVWPDPGTVFIFTPPEIPVSYLWTPGASVVNSTADVTASYGLTTSTEFTVTVTSTAPGSCSSSATAFVSVGEQLVCSPATSGGPFCDGNSFSVKANVSGGGNKTFTWQVNNSPSFTGTQVQTFNLASGFYTVTCTVTDDCGGSCTSSTNVTVNALPSAVLVSPSTSAICIPGGSPAILSASGASVYTWSPSNGLSVTSGAVVSALPSANTVYTITATDGNGCTSTATTSVYYNSGVVASNVTASPPSVCSGSSSLLTANAYCFIGSIIISEVTQFRLGNGATSPYPSWVSAAPDDYVEISNISGVTVDVSGLEYQLWTSNSIEQTLILPTGTMIPSNAVLIIALGTGTNNTTNRFYNTGGPNGPTFSSTATGHLIRSGSFIVDAVALNSFIWPVSSGVTSANWSGDIPNSGSFAGVIRNVAVDNNTASDWVVSNATMLQTIGTYNGGYTAPVCDLNYAWTPSTFFIASTGNPVSANNIGSTTEFTVTVTSSDGCSGTKTATVVAGLQLNCSAPTVSSPLCDGSSFTVTANVTGGAQAYTYTWSEGATILSNNNFSISMTKPAGTYLFSALVTDVCGNTCSSAATVVVNGLPNVSISPSIGQVCNPGGSPVLLTASGADSYLWKFSSATSSTISVIPTSNKIYSVTGTGANGCTNIATASVQVGLYPSNIVATAIPSIICSNDNAQLNVSATIINPASVSSYQFTGSTGVFTSISGVAVTHGTITDNGWVGNLPIGFNFTYEGIVYSVFGVSPNGWIQPGLATTASTGGASNLLANTAGIIAPLWDDNNIVGGSISYSTTGTQGSRVLTVQWINLHVGGGGLSTNPTISMQVKLYETTGAVEFIYDSVSAALLNITASIGIAGTVGDFLSVTPASPPASSTVSSVVANNLIASSADFPSGTRYTFLTPPIPISYIWEPGLNVVNSNIKNPLTKDIPVGSTMFTVTVTNNGCSATGSVTVVSGSVLTANNATVSSTSICSNTNFTITAMFNGGGAPFNYSWDDGNGGSYPNAKSIVCNLPAGTYTFNCTITDGCLGSCISSVSVVVLDLPNVEINPPIGQICNPGGSPVFLTASGATSYVWNPTSATTPGISVNPVFSTIYFVTGTNAAGCRNTASAFVKVGINPTNVVATVTPSSVCPGSNSQLNSSATIRNVSPVNSYSFISYSSVYTQLSGGTPVTAVQFDDAISGAIPLPFTFIYEGYSYSSIYATSNGALTFSAPPGSLTLNNLATGITRPVIAPLWDDLSGSSSGQAFYLTTGTSPNQVFAFEWRKWRWTYTATAGVISFEARLYESDNHIEFIYEDDGGTVSNPSASIGLSGMTLNNFISLNNTSASPIASSVTETNTIGVKPVSGQVYSFIPPPATITYVWAPAANVNNSTLQNPLSFDLPAGQTVYTVTITNNGCSVSQSVNVNVLPCGVSLFVKVWIEGYYVAGCPGGCDYIVSQMRPCLFYNEQAGTLPPGPYGMSDCDFLDISAMDATDGSLVESQTGILHTDGSINVSFANISPSASYYIRLTHRNALEVWSSVPIIFSATTALLPYDFTTDVTKAFAYDYSTLPMHQMADGPWAILSGDMGGLSGAGFQDGNVDLYDYNYWDMDNAAFNFGYLVGDLNGDVNVDLYDFDFWDMNNSTFEFVQRPF